jgi:hypothetical protein
MAGDLDHFLIPGRKALEEGIGVEPHGLKPVPLHMLRRAEPSEAHLTTLI